MDPAAREALLAAAIVRPDTPLSVGSARCRPTARFHLVSRLGQGSFGVVFRAVDTGSQAGTCVAFKRLKDIYGSHHDLLCALRELSIMRQCHHPNVIGNSTHRSASAPGARPSQHYYPVLSPPAPPSPGGPDTSLWFAMDLCELGDLGRLMKVPRHTLAVRARKLNAVWLPESHQSWQAQRMERPARELNYSTGALAAAAAALRKSASCSCHSVWMVGCMLIVVAAGAVVTACGVRAAPARAGLSSRS